MPALDVVTAHEVDDRRHRAFSRMPVSLLRPSAREMERDADGTDRERAGDCPEPCVNRR